MAVSAHARNVIFSPLGGLDAVATSTRVSCPAKALALAIAIYAARHPGGVPTEAELRALAGFRASKTYRQARRQLERAGLLRVDRLRGAGSPIVAYRLVGTEGGR